MCYYAVIVFSGILCLLNKGAFAVPVPPQLSKSCDVLSFIQKTGEAEHGHHLNSETLPSYCNDISADTPTEVHLKSGGSEESCGYQVLQYSGPGCHDDAEISRVPLNKEKAEVVLNERKSICSYKLEKSPESANFVRVNFSGGRARPVSDTVKDTGCYNLCSDPADTYYPGQVGVYKDDTEEVLEHSGIVLFSERQCQDNSEIRDADNNVVTVRIEENLAALTRINPPQRVVQSFKVIAT